jgi:hypothetical protein
MAPRHRVGLDGADAGADDRVTGGDACDFGLVGLDDGETEHAGGIQYRPERDRAAGGQQLRPGTSL